MSLKHCAHCGHDAIPPAYSEEYGLWNIECTRCPASMWAETKKLVEEAWDTRAADTRADKLAAAIRSVAAFGKPREGSEAYHKAFADMCRAAELEVE